MSLPARGVWIEIYIKYDDESKPYIVTPREGSVD